MTRLALVALLVTGCATTVPPLSEAPGAKRLPTTDTGTPSHMQSAKHRSRHRRPAVSRSLRRSAVGSRLNWPALAHCESTGNPRAVDPSGRYFGLYQFDLSTWVSVGGVGSPVAASPTEQTYRAELLYARAGDAPWPVCGWRLAS